MTQPMFWRKSSYSPNGGANCVEAGVLADGRFVIRDSKDRGGPVLTFSRTAWQAFLAGIRS
jgi:Domain of unknown function (DUF397)